MNISIEKAKHNKLFYVVTTGVIYNPKLKKCLIVKRSEKEIAHPGLWGVVGGKLEWNDLKDNPVTRVNHGVKNWEGLVEMSLIREAFEEAGVIVKNPQYLESVVFLRPDNVPVALLQYALEYVSGKVKLAPEFDDYAWVNVEESKKYNLIDGIKEEIAKTIKLYLA